jgi:homoserine O-acetyltransferase
MGAERFRYVNGRLISKTMKQETNPESPLVPSNMKYAFVPELRLESGHILRHVRVAYTTQGQLNYQGTNAVVVCHALSGNADAKGDWWAGLFNGPEAILIICLNVLGSPYGTTSPLTFIDDDPSQARWGPNFPCTSIRDDVWCVLIINLCVYRAQTDNLSQSA